MLSPSLFTTLTILALRLSSALVCCDLSQCASVEPLGLTSGVITDSQLSASSSFTSAVGPGMGRAEREEGGGAWCPLGLVSQERPGQEWLEVDLGRRMRISGLGLQGRWGAGQGAEWSPGVSVAWYDEEREVFVASSEVYPANTDTYSLVTVQLSQAIETRKIRVIPVSDHPRAVCLRLELYGCQIDQDTAGDESSDTGTIRPDIGDIPDDDRKEIAGQTPSSLSDYDLGSALTDHNIFPVVVALLALISIVLIILSVLLLRKISQSRKAGQLAAASEVHYLQNTLHTNYHQAPPQMKKNIYEVPRVEPIYSTPIEIFFPPSPSSLSTDSSECETFRASPGTGATTSTPAPTQQSWDSFKSPKSGRFEDFVTFSPIYSYFTTPAEPKYSNIV